MYNFTLQQNIHTALGVLLMLAFILPSFLYSPNIVSAAFNEQINYQGKLLDNTSAPVTDGNYSIVFTLYNAPTAGATIWTETNSVAVTAGLFSIMLGSTTPLTNVDFNQTLYLGINVAADGEMTPRKILGAVPAAFQANEADNAQTLGGVASTSLLRSDQDDTASGLLTFTGGFISSASSTITNLTTSIATTTTLVINGESFTDFTGSGLTNTAGVLTTNISESNLNIAGAPVDGYILQASSTSAGDFMWVATSSLGFISDDTSILKNHLQDSGTLSFDWDDTEIADALTISSSGTIDPQAITLAAGYVLYGDASNNALATSSLFVAADGNVGVGTLNPGDKLTIRSIDATVYDDTSVQTGSGGTLSIWNTDNTDNNFAQILFNNRSTGQAKSRIVSIGTSANNTDLAFVTESANVLSEKLRITGEGNVGIGTTSPTYKLSVVGDAIITGALHDSTNNAGTNGYVLQTTGASTEWVATSTLGFGTGNGSVTSVAASVPTGWTISGSPITTAGTLAFTYDAGYAAVLTASTTDWQTAFGWGDHSLGGYEGDLSNEAGLYAALSDVTDFYQPGDTLSSGTLALNSLSYTGTLNHEYGGLELDISGVGIGDVIAGSAAGTLEIVDGGAAADGDVLMVQADGTVNFETPAAGHAAVTLAGQDYLTLSTQQITAGEIEPDDLANSDFGDFSCNGTTCSLDIDTIAAAEMANSDHGFFTYTTGVAALDTDGLTSANLATALTNETGSGALVFGTSPTFTTSITMGAATLSEAELEILDGATLSTTELNYVDGVTSDIQTQFGTKEGTLTNEAGLYAALSDVTQFWEAGDTITSGIWQGTAIADAYLTKTGAWTGTIDGNNFSGGAVATGDLLYGSGAGTIAERTIGATGEVLQVVGGVPVWVATSTLGLAGSGSDTTLTENEVEAFIFDADAETILGNWVNTANPWADNEVSDTLTASNLTSLGNYVWSTSTTAKNMPLGISNSFVRAVEGWPNYGSVMNMRTYSGGGGSVQIYAPYGSSNGGDQLRFRLADYNADVGDPPWTDWKTIWDDTSDGSGSTLDADLLDGLSSAAFETDLSNSAGLLAALSDETGTGLSVFSTAPTFTTSITMGAATLSEAELEILDGATLSTTELNYVDGVTSDIQTQINNNEGELTNSAGLLAALSDETGTGLSVFSISPTLTGTIDAVAGDFSSTLTMSGSAANIALGSNYLSGDGGDEGIYIDSVGKVGIGTTTPNQTLTVDGDMSLSGLFYDATGSSGVLGDVLVRGASGLAWAATSTLGIKEDDDTLLSHTFTEEETWSALTGIAGSPTIGIILDALDLVSGQLSLLIDGTEVERVPAGEEISRVVRATNSVSVVAEGEEFTLKAQTTAVGEILLEQFGTSITMADLTFSNDGTKLYIVDSGTRDIFEFTLSVAYDATTALYVDSLDISDQTTQPTDVMFNDDGTLLYILANTNSAGSDQRNILSYDVAVPYDVSRAEYDSAHAISETVSADAFVFNDDGSKLYVLDNSTRDITQFDLSVAYDISTETVSDTPVPISTQFSTMYGMTFNASGTKMYIAYQGSNGAVAEFSLASAYEISTIHSTGTIYPTTGTEDDPTGIAFSSDGSKMYVVGTFSDTLHQYTLDDAYDLQTTDYENKFSIETVAYNAQDVTFNDDGTKMYHVDSTEDAVFEYDLSVAYDVDTALYQQKYSVAGRETEPRGLAFNTDGTKMFVTGTTGDDVNEFALSVAWDVSSATYTRVFSVILDPEDVTFSPDGTAMFVVYRSGDSIYQYTLGTGYDLSTAAYTRSKSITADNTDPTDVVFNASGTKMFTINVAATPDQIVSHTLSTDFDISTAIFESKFDVTSQASTLTGLAFNTDGTEMIVLSNGDDAVSKYTLSTGFDLNTASFPGAVYVGEYQTVPEDVVFNDDGTLMYIIGATNDAIHALELSVAYDVSTAVFPDYFEIYDYDVQSTDIEFNADGTKMFTIGQQNDDVYEFVLDTAYEISSANYAGVYSIAETTPEGLHFSPDGTKMFVVGSQNDRVYEYTLGTGFDLTTASYTDYELVSAQETSPSDVTFNTDGTKMFVLGWTGRDVNEYTLSTGFDLSSTVTFIDSYNVSAEETLPNGVTFNASGTKMYIIGQTGDDVNEYTLSVGFDVSTATSTATNFSVADQGTIPEGLAFNATGDQMFVVDSNSDTVHAYDLDIDYDLSSANTLGNYYSVTDEETVPTSLAFNTDGTKMFVIGTTGDDVNEYSLSIAFDIATASYVDSVSVSGQELSPQTLRFNADGTKMFVMGTSGDDVNEYTLSVGFDVSSTVTFIDSFSVATEEANPYGLSFNTAGTKMYVIGITGKDVNEYTLSTGFDVSTASFDGSFPVDDEENTPHAITFNPAGTKMYITGGGKDHVHQYILDESFKVVNVAHEAILELPTNETQSTDIVFNNDGTQMFVLGMQYDKIVAYGLDIAYDLNSSYPTKTFSVASEETTPTGLHFSPDGTKMFITGQAGDDVNEYTLSAGFDIATASYVDSVSINGQEGTVEGVTFNTDGTKMFVVGASGDDVNEYTLSVGFDVSSTVTFIDSFDVSGEETNPTGVTFNASGTRMFVIGQTGDDVNEYALSTGFDVSTASFDGNFSVEDGTPEGLALSAGGLSMFVLGSTDDSIVKYSLQSASNLGRITFVDSFSVSSQDTTPQAVRFNPDGDLMYVLGGTGDDLNEYALSTNFDVSTASFLSSFYLGDQNTAPGDFVITPDGTRLLMLGKTSNVLYEYILNTPYDTSSAQYVDNLSVNAQDTQIYSFTFNPAGTTMYMYGNANTSIYEYSLNSGYDISTAVYVSSFSIPKISTYADSMSFNSNGTKFYIIGNDTDQLEEFDLDEPYNVRTAAYVGKFAVTAEETVPYGFAFNTEGTKLFVTGQTGDDVNEYTLTPTPWVGTASAVITAEGELGGADLAELYPVQDEAIEAGDIVSFADNNSFALTYGTSGSPLALAGIISTQPGIVLSDNTEGNNARPLALSGRVPTKVNLEGGVIAPGDRITPSSIPGVGRKATLFEPSVGTALTAYDSENPVEQQTVMVFVRLDEGVNIYNLTDTLFAGATTTFILPQAEIFASSTLTEGVDATTASTSDKVISTESIWSRLADLASRFRNGILALVGLTLGSSESPTGITTYDVATGESYCMVVKSGQTTALEGACKDIDLADFEDIEIDEANDTGIDDVTTIKDDQATSTDDTQIDTEQASSTDAVAEDDASGGSDDSTSQENTTDGEVSESIDSENATSTTENNATTTEVMIDDSTASSSDTTVDETEEVSVSDDSAESDEEVDDTEEVTEVVEDEVVTEEPEVAPDEVFSEESTDNEIIEPEPEPEPEPEAEDAVPEEPAV